MMKTLKGSGEFVRPVGTLLHILQIAFRVKRNKEIHKIPEPNFEAASAFILEKIDSDPIGSQLELGKPVSYSRL